MGHPRPPPVAHGRGGRWLQPELDYGMAPLPARPGLGLVVAQRLRSDPESELGGGTLEIHGPRPRAV
jgi:hypothetical protein